MWQLVFDLLIFFFQSLLSLSLSPSSFQNPQCLPWLCVCVRDDIQNTTKEQGTRVLSVCFVSLLVGMASIVWSNQKEKEREKFVCVVAASVTGRLAFVFT